MLLLYKMSIIGANVYDGFPNITGNNDAEFNNITVDNISVANKLSFEEADATDEGNMTTFIYQDPTTHDIVVNNNNPLGAFRLQYGNTPDTNILSFEIDAYNQKLNFPVGVNPENNISFEELYALKGVNINQSIQQQINSINQISQGTGYWGLFFSTIDQTFAAENTAQIATLNTADANNNGMILFNQSGANYNSVKVLNGATYNVQIVFQVSSSSSSSGLVRAWVRLNGTDLPNSSAGIKEHSNNGYLIISYNLILQLVPNDVLTFMIAGSNTEVHLEAITAQASPFVCPASPSVYISIQQITYYQKAELQNIYGLFQSNTTMTDASPNYVGVKWQSGFNSIRLPDATTTPLGKEYTFFMVNPIPFGSFIRVNTYSISQYFYYFGFSDNTTIELTSQTQSFVFTCISNSANPYWSVSQVEYDPSLFFNLDGPNVVPYTTIFTQTGTINPAIQMRTGTYLSLEGNILANTKTITPVELSFIDGTTSNIQGQLSTLQDKTTMISFFAPSITKIDYNVQLGTAGQSGYVALYNDISANGATITPVELSYIDGTTSNIQGQLTTLQQKTTAMTYTSTGLMTTIAYNLTVGSLYANNYIFVGGTNIYDIYTPRGLCYTKGESDAKYATQAELGTVSAATGLNTAAIALYITGVAPPNIIPVFFGPAVGLNNAFPAFVAAYTITAGTVSSQATAISTLQTKTQYQSTGINETFFSGKLTTSYGGSSISIDPGQNKINASAGQSLSLASSETLTLDAKTVNINATEDILLNAADGVSVMNGLRTNILTPQSGTSISLNSGTTGGTVNIGNTLDLVYINGLPFSLWFFAQW